MTNNITKVDLLYDDRKFCLMKTEYENWTKSAQK